MNSYGLRNPKTGRILRIAEERRFMKPPIIRLSEDATGPYWKTGLADLIMTWAESPSDDDSTELRPAWGDVLPRELPYQPIRFRTDFEYDVDGGDPVSTTERIESFDMDGVYDLRPSLYQTTSIDSIHYGILQGIFPTYDMDRHENMSIAIVAHQRGSHINMRGDIGLTEDKGPARIVDFAVLPDDWPLTEEQAGHRPYGDETAHALLLLDRSELEVWLDFDQMDVDVSLSRTVA